MASPVYETPDYEVDHILSVVLAPYAIDPAHIVPYPDPRSSKPLRGGYGTVERSFLLKAPGADEGKQVVAVKKFVVDDQLHHERLKRRAVREILLWSGLRHPNVLDFTGFHLDVPTRAAWLVSPWEAAGDLLGYVKNHSPVPNERVHLIRDACEGLQYLHSRNPPICHGDVKGANILIRPSTNGQAPRAILCDFGLSRIIDDESDRTSVALDTAQVWAGSVRWSSPEIFAAEGLVRTPQSDVWALGWLAWEVMTERIPYWTVKLDVAVIAYIVQMKLPLPKSDPEDPLLAKIPPALRTFIQRCWEEHPSERAPIQQCLSDISALLDKTTFSLPAAVPAVSDDVLATCKPTVRRRPRVTKRPASIAGSLPRRRSNNFDNYASLQAKLEQALQEAAGDSATTIASEETAVDEPFENQLPPSSKMPGELDDSYESTTVASSIADDSSSKGAAISKGDSWITQRLADFFAPTSVKLFAAAAILPLVLIPVYYSWRS